MRVYLWVVRCRIRTSLGLGLPTRTLGWKLRSSLFRSTEASGSTEGSKYSRMEKGLAGSQTSNYPALFANRDMTEGASRSTDTELIPVMVGGSR